MSWVDKKDGEGLQPSAVRSSYVALKAAHRHPWTPSCIGRRDKANTCCLCVCTALWLAVGELLKAAEHRLSLLSFKPSSNYDTYFQY